MNKIILSAALQLSLALRVYGQWEVTSTLTNPYPYSIAGYYAGTYQDDNIGYTVSWTINTGTNWVHFSIGGHAAAWPGYAYGLGGMYIHFTEQYYIDHTNGVAIAGPYLTNGYAGTLILSQPLAATNFPLFLPQDFPPLATPSQLPPLLTQLMLRTKAKVPSNQPSLAGTLATTNSALAASRADPYWVGFGFVPVVDTTVCQLARMAVYSPSVTSHPVMILSSSAIVASNSVSMVGVAVGQYAYANIASVVLTAGQTYYLVSQEGNGDSWSTLNTITVKDSDIGSVGSAYNGAGGGGSEPTKGSAMGGYTPGSNAEYGNATFVISSP